MRRTLFLLLLLALSRLSFAQVFIEPFAGYQKDLNDHKNNLINSGLQLALKKKKYEFLVQVQRAWPQSHSGMDSSFTLNTALPLSAAAQKTFKPSSFTMAIGNRIKVLGRHTRNSLFVKIYTGIMYQQMTVSYQYDKTNYIVLNPDQTTKNTGIYISGGLEYLRSFQTGRLFVDLNFSSPPSGKIKYPASFDLRAPVSVNFGYSIQLSKK